MVYVYHFSERSHKLYAVACPSVTFVRPTQLAEIFGNVSYAIWYLCHPFTSTENFMEIIASTVQQCEWTLNDELCKVKSAL